MFWTRAHDCNCFPSKPMRWFKLASELWNSAFENIVFCPALARNLQMPGCWVQCDFVGWNSPPCPPFEPTRSNEVTFSTNTQCPIAQTVESAPKQLVEKSFDEDALLTLEIIFDKISCLLYNWGTLKWIAICTYRLLLRILSLVVIEKWIFKYMRFIWCSLI